jgi:hypothetical protein
VLVLVTGADNTEAEGGRTTTPDLLSTAVVTTVAGVVVVATVASVTGAVLEVEEVVVEVVGSTA